MNAHTMVKGLIHIDTTMGTYYIHTYIHTYKQTHTHTYTHTYTCIYILIHS